ncbi:hypothetical protein [Liquorilactobacillus mali]|uniref:DUF2187 domain-containing protein n=1 Tax=Liquorilactobacillus mali KCTC 3596 = DSM 20444 TaxID=1046596 RepID=A0A0R2E0E2_9LACO|nr:hypothetical protein [Liquorilactobacillus mali]KRN09762.1 hypothetical protein FD00_GL000698 [Liquorilactobacillus mali KCTC 3596 = DSM 20444]MDC7953350.1 hypothetical protein [Liquorilactobacillus mali]
MLGNEKRNDQNKQIIEVNELGEPFIERTHVSFIFNRQHFKGIVEKQLKNSAIIDFDDEYSGSETALDLKQKVVISYSKMKLLN